MASILGMGLLGPNAVGQTPDNGPKYIQRQWTGAEGLPVNSVNDIGQDRDGYLWLATFDGLVRFDGTEFRTFRSGQEPGLPSSSILSLLVRPDGIWMRTESWHVVRYHNCRFTTVAEDVDRLREGDNGEISIVTNEGAQIYRNGTFETIRTGDVSAVLPASNSTVWVGTKETVFRRTADGHTWSPVSVDGHVTDLEEDGRGRIWIGSRNGLYRWQNGHLLHVPVAGQESPSIEVIRVVSYAQGTCLVAAVEGIFRCNDDRLVPLVQGSFSEDTFRNGLGDIGPDGQVWLNAETEVYRGDTAVFDTDGTVQRVFADREGNIWIGTDRNGLFRLRPSLFTIYGEPEGLASSNIYPIEQRRNGSIWLGTLGGGVTRIRGPADVTTFRPSKSGKTLNNVWALHEDRSGRLWMSGGDGRLCQFEADDCVQPTANTPIRGRIRALYEDRRGRLWAGSKNRGLYRCQSNCLSGPEAWIRYVPNDASLPPAEVRRVQDVRPSRLPHAYVRTIHETPDGTIWVGTNGGGVARYTNGLFQPLTTSDGLSSNLVRDIFQDTTASGLTDVLWIVTEDNGLNRVEVRPSDTAFATSVTVYQKEDGLYDNALHQMLTDKQGRYWLSSNRGLFSVQKAELKAFARGDTTEIHSVSYTTRDGLRTNEANGGIQPAGLRAQDGRLWFPTQQGAVVIDPETVTAADAPPPVHIETIVSNDSVVARNAEGPLHLAASQRDFDIKFTGIQLANPESVSFRYRLKGLQTNWQEVGDRRRVFFTSVPPGTYTFEVAARTNGGRWNDPPAQLAITVPPYFYETWWFYGLCVLGLCLAGYGGVRYWLRALQRRKILLEEKVAERTRKLRETNEQLEEARERAVAAAKAKSYFLANMSHEIRTPLTSIIGFAETIGTEADDLDLPASNPLSDYADLIERSGKRLLDTLGGVLNLSKLETGRVELTPEAIDLTAEANRTIEELRPKAEEKDIYLHLPDENTPVWAEVDGDGMQIVARNLLSNAIKYTHEGGNIWVRTHRKRGRATFEVEDNGIGMESARAERLFEPFRQASEGLDREYEGTGIGLAVTKKTVEQMDGSIEVETEKGVGSRFAVHLPTAERPSD